MSRLIAFALFFFLLGVNASPAPVLEGLVNTVGDTLGGVVGAVGVQAEVSVGGGNAPPANPPPAPTPTETAGGPAPTPVTDAPVSGGPAVPPPSPPVAPGAPSAPASPSQQGQGTTPLPSVSGTSQGNDPAAGTTGLAGFALGSAQGLNMQQDQASVGGGQSTSTNINGNRVTGGNTGNTGGNTNIGGDSGATDGSGGGSTTNPWRQTNSNTIVFSAVGAVAGCILLVVVLGVSYRRYQGKGTTSTFVLPTSLGKLGGGEKKSPSINTTSSNVSSEAPFPRLGDTPAWIPPHLVSPARAPWGGSDMESAVNAAAEMTITAETTSTTSSPASIQKPQRISNMTLPSCRNLGGLLSDSSTINRMLESGRSTPQGAPSIHESVMSHESINLGTQGRSSDTSGTLSLQAASMRSGSTPNDTFARDWSSNTSGTMKLEAASIRSGSSSATPNDTFSRAGTPSRPFVLGSFFRLDDRMLQNTEDALESSDAALTLSSMRSAQS
ncbi:hypothetical protein HK102_000270 [Quaeritorhiza haematococci]|nr:hypothetical protein HK102_000270 [Quaeritorhiza haematococci]